MTADVEAVKPQNLDSVNLYFDDSFFKGEIYGPNWDSALFEEYYAVPITGLGIDNNILKFFGLIDEGTNVFTIEALPLEKFGSILDKRVLKSSSADLVNPMTAVWVSGKGVTLTGDTLKDLAFFTNAVVKEPGDFAARLLAQELDKAGIKVLSVGRATNPLLYGELLYQHDSAPLSKVIFDMLKFSQNHYAEAIIRALGENAGPSSNSQKAGVAVLNQFLDEIGVPQGEVLAFDGSGISPDTRATSNSILMLFDYINQQDWAQSFWDSLPEAGVDGTLRGRFGDIDDDIHLMAKTGTHVGANSLSGKIDRKNGKSILFSIHVFGHVYSVQEATKFVVPVIDDVVSFLDKQY